MSTDFYIYCLAIDKEILYIGKGKKNRSKKHLPLLLEGKHPNPKLQNKFNKTEQKEKLQDFIIYENLSETSAFQYEIELIKQIGIENLCNLTNGGEGGDCITNNPRRLEIIKKSATSRIGRKTSKETIQKIQNSKQNWYHSPEYEEFKKKMSESRKGSNNPMYGHKEDEESIRKRMKNCLAKPRWNKGLTKDKDSRLNGPPKGNVPVNIKSITVIDIETNEETAFIAYKYFFNYVKSKLGKCNTKKIYKMINGETEIYERWRIKKS